MNTKVTHRLDLSLKRLPPGAPFVVLASQEVVNFTNGTINLTAPFLTGPCGLIASVSASLPADLLPYNEGD
jgi:hypothetical protein